MDRVVIRTQEIGAGHYLVLTKSDGPNASWVIFERYDYKHAQTLEHKSERSELWRSRITESDEIEAKAMFRLCRRCYVQGRRIGVKVSQTALGELL